MKNSIFRRTALQFLFSLILICFVLVLKTNTVYSQTEVEKIPFHIVSDKMVAQQDISMVEFIGNVKATRENSIILADSIKIYFAENTTDKDDPAQSNVKKIVSTGNVRYTEGDQKAFADKMVYTTQDEVLILTGKSPKVIIGSSFVTGKIITLFRNQDKVMVESDDTKRVEAFFNPEDNKKNKQ